MEEPRIAEIERKTGETQVKLTLKLDGKGESRINTGIPFFDHMLELFARHGHFDIDLGASGDTEVDYHHTVEDIGLVLGDAFAKALGERAGIRRYGFFLLPMDETLARVAIDLSNRPYLVFRVDPKVRFVRDFNILLFREFFQAFVNRAGANLHILHEYGDEPHHIMEAIFKAFARALDLACSLDPREEGRILSTKGIL